MQKLVQKSAKFFGSSNIFRRTRLLQVLTITKLEESLALCMRIYSII